MFLSWLFLEKGTTAGPSSVWHSQPKTAVRTKCACERNIQLRAAEEKRALKPLGQGSATEGSWGGWKSWKTGTYKHGRGRPDGGNTDEFMSFSPQKEKHGACCTPASSSAPALLLAVAVWWVNGKFWSARCKLLLLYAFIIRSGLNASLARTPLCFVSHHQPCCSGPGLSCRPYLACCKLSALYL